MKDKDNEDMMKVILKSYDIKHLKKKCNFNGCKKKPTKLVEIVERNNVKKRVLTKLYLCDEHLKSVDELILKLKKMSRGVIIEKKVLGL